MEDVIKSIEGSEEIVVLTGAGMSVESGIAPFRGEDGLWNEFDPQEMASISSFRRNPERCWKLFKLQIEECFEAEPHEGYSALVELEKNGLRTVITQNVDGLHKKAGSEEVLELHGTLDELTCDSCGNLKKTNEFKDEILDGKIPDCNCGAVMRPNVILFGEALPQKTLQQSWSVVEKCDLFMSIGTSSIVQPAASLPLVAKRNGADIIEINIENTSLTPNSDYFVEGKAGEVLSEIIKRLRGKLMQIPI